MSQVVTMTCVKVGEVTSEPSTFQSYTRVRKKNFIMWPRRRLLLGLHCVNLL